MGKPRGTGIVQGKRQPVMVDVREEVEYALGAKVEGSVNIPISRILRHGYRSTDGDGGGDDIRDLLGEYGREELAADGGDRSTYFVCQQDNDSQIAAKKFLDSDGGNGGRRWIGDVVGGFEALLRNQQQQQQQRS
jgi:adenylyltransferase and sulfurtransferase